VYNMHSILGKKNKLHVLGLLAQKEDSHFYLEDATASVRLVFTELQWADPDAFFCENMCLLCEGYYSNEVF